MSSSRMRYLNAADRVEAAETDDIMELVRIAELDLRTAFRGGDWSGCDFSYADLRGADFACAILSGANFDGALIDGANFEDAVDVDLRRADRKIAYGEGLKWHDYQQRLMQAASFKAAQRIKREMDAAGSPPTRSLFNMILAKAQSLADAEGVLDEIRRRVRADNVTYMTFIAKFGAQFSADRLLALMRADGVRPDTRLFGTLIAKSPNYSEALILAALMNAEGARQNAFSHSCLIAKAPDYETALRHYERMRGEGFEATRLALRGLVAKSPTFDEAKKWIDLIEMRWGSANVGEHNLLLSKAKNDGDRVAAMARFQGVIVPNQKTFDVLVSKAEDLNAALAMLGGPDGDSGKPSERTFTYLIAKCESGDDVLRVLDRMGVCGVATGLLTVRALLSCRALDWDVKAEGRRLLRQHASTVAVSAFVSAAASRQWKRALRRLPAPAARKAYLQIPVWLAGRVESATDARSLSVALLMRKYHLSTAFYSALYERLAPTWNASDLFSWHFAQRFRKWHALDVAVSAFEAIGKVEDALRVALACPAMPNARLCIRRHSLAAESMFMSFIEKEPKNATLALAYCHLERGSLNDALSYFRAARSLLRRESDCREVETRISELVAEVGESL